MAPSDEAQRIIDLYRLTGMPLVDCRAAIREAPGDEKEYLRRLYAQRQPRGTTWVYPDGLRRGRADAG